jgi:AcrR family transcriptional regulator
MRTSEIQLVGWLQATATGQTCQQTSWLDIIRRMPPPRTAAAQGRRLGRSATDTRARILAAATSEFAERGLAGGRVDRIAVAAEANKERIYAYFGSKEGLFDASVEAIIGELLDTVPFDAVDLPGYAARLYDFTLGHPQLIRLALWHSLERPGSIEQLPQSADSTVRKIRTLTAAQRDGLVDASLPADRMLPLILGLVHAGLILAPLPTDPVEVAAQRDAVRVAVSRLVNPPG